MVISDTIKQIIYKGGFSLADEKKTNPESREDAVLSKNSGESGYTPEALNDELEMLAGIFREELKNAEQMPEEEFIEAFADELGIIPDDELCECCGERRKDKTHGKGYQYCSVCRENMKHYPFGIVSVLIAIAVIVLSIASVMNFADDFGAYNYFYKAEQAEKENKLNSAIEYYDSAIAAFEAREIKSKRAYLSSAQLKFSTMNEGTTTMYEVATLVEKALTDFEKKLPFYKGYLDMRDESLVLYGTMQKFYDIISAEEYAEYSPENTEMYKEIMTKIGSLIDEDISVLSVDGKTTKMVPASEGMVRFCQYMFAYISEQYDDSYQYMVQTEELLPSYLWLYAYELGFVESQSGNFSKAKELAEKIVAWNVEDADGYSLYTSVERLNGNYEKALRWANKGIEHNPENAELMRLKAMALCCQGKNEEAKKVLDEGLAIQEYAVMYFTAIVIENELGNKDAVESYKAALEEQEVEMSDRINDYLAGKLTAQQLFTEGTGEVE